MTVLTDPHILAIGEALMDVVTRPGSDVPPQEIPGGSPANVALTLGRLGRAVALSTWLAQDPYGTVIRHHLEASHVTFTPESFGASHTTTSTALIDASGAASYTFDMEWAPLDPLPLPAGAQIVHAGSIAAAANPGANPVLDALIRARSQALVTFDPNARPSIMGEPADALALMERYVAISDVVKVSDEDIAWMTGGADLMSVVDHWLAMGPQLVIVTRGKEGGLACTTPGLRIAATPGDVTVVDTVGAGDSFMGGILDALWELGLRGAGARNRLRELDEATVRTILERASRISDITVSRAGANPPWADELN